MPKGGSKTSPAQTRWSWYITACQENHSSIEHQYPRGILISTRPRYGASMTQKQRGKGVWPSTGPLR